MSASDQEECDNISVISECSLKAKLIDGNSLASDTEADDSPYLPSNNSSIDDWSESDDTSISADEASWLHNDTATCRFEVNKSSYRQVTRQQWNEYLCFWVELFFYYSYVFFFNWIKWDSLTKLNLTGMFLMISLGWSSSKYYSKVVKNKRYFHQNAIVLLELHSQVEVFCFIPALWGAHNWATLWASYFANIHD